MANRRPTVQLPADNRQRGSYNPPPRIYQYQRNRRKFATKAYGLAVIAMVISTAQWIPFYLLSSTRDFFRNYYYVSMIFLFVTLLLISLFIFFERVRFTFPLNWIFALLIVECVTMGMIGAFVAHSDLLLFSLALALAFLLTLAFVLFGIILPHDFTLDVVVLFLVSVIFFIGSVFFVMLHVLMSVPGTELVYSSFVIISVGLFTIYHAQTINGGRYAEMRLTDFILAGLIIFHDFVLFLISTFLIVLVLWSHYIDWNNNKLP